MKNNSHTNKIINSNAKQYMPENYDVYVYRLLSQLCGIKCTHHTLLKKKERKKKLVHLLFHLHLGNLPSLTCPCPREITTYFTMPAASLILYSYQLFSTFLNHLFSESLCFHNISCPLHYSHLLNSPSSIKFVFIPLAYLPHVFRSPRRHQQHRAPGREPQAGLVAAVGALPGICKLQRPCSIC